MPSARNGRISGVVTRVALPDGDDILPRWIVLAGQEADVRLDEFPRATLDKIAKNKLQELADAQLTVS